MKESEEVWKKCLLFLEDKISEKDYNTWINPLSISTDNKADNILKLSAPNRFIKDWLDKQLLNQLNEAVDFAVGNGASVVIDTTSSNESSTAAPASSRIFTTNRLEKTFTLENHIEGKSNQIARAATKQVAENPSGSYNPLFIYGGVGLGKTHLMHAAGNIITQKNSQLKVVYVHSERFVADMVKSIESHSMNEFKKFYRSLDALLIDDIQFFAGKEHSQEEFFHTYNTLLEIGAQIILTSDKFPKEINSLQGRLISRFEAGLTVRIDPPELETRVAILHSKARRKKIQLCNNVAFWVAKKIHSNVRELEGAINRLAARAEFTGKVIDLDLAKNALQDLLTFQERKISIDNIQKTVAEFYGIRVMDLKSKRRNRRIARPRQIAMALTKDFTSKSLPDIGDSFGGRDHATVIHACRKVEELIKTDPQISQDYRQLQNILSA